MTVFWVGLASPFPRVLLSQVLLISTCTPSTLKFQVSNWSGAFVFKFPSAWECCLMYSAALWVLVSAEPWLGSTSLIVILFPVGRSSYFDLLHKLGHYWSAGSLPHVALSSPKKAYTLNLGCKGCCDTGACSFFFRGHWVFVQLVSLPQSGFLYSPCLWLLAFVWWEVHTVFALLALMIPIHLSSLLLCCILFCLRNFFSMILSFWGN